MGVVMCSRCDRWVDLDYDVESMVVLPDGINYACVDCLEATGELCEECGEPIWTCDCKQAVKP